ncbi:hypothetical protein ABZ783_29080 [Micromonospora sp. NPDC047738]|uniref:hypothetical protein n=1 Tax=Micromonospora sp. NPDC047738 TaxID=3155741 RepID=UPI0033E795F6
MKRRHVPRCACFGATERPLGRRHVVRNGLLLASVAAALVAVALGAAYPNLLELFLPVSSAPPIAPSRRDP